MKPSVSGSGCWRKAEIPGLVVKTAHACLGAGRRQQAMKLLEKHQAEGGLNESGYSLLASLYTVDDSQFSKALRVFEEAKERSRYAGELQLEHAVALLINQRANEALPILESLSSIPPEQDTNHLGTSARLFLSVIHAGQTNRAASRKY
jgi:tetratricopeptide (TPR) repeat protein